MGLNASMNAEAQLIRLSTDAAIVSPIFIDQYAYRRTIGVFKLAVTHRPQESDEARSAQKQRYWDKDQQSVHRAALVKRKALATTSTEDVDMAMAAIIGVTIPARASGTANIL